MNTTTRRAAIAAVGLLLIVLLGATAYLFTQGTFADVEGSEEWTFASNPGFDGCINTGSSFSYYGNEVRVENHRISDSEWENNVLAATVHIGDESFEVYKSNWRDEFHHDGIVVELTNRDTQEYVGCWYSRTRYDRDYTTNFMWTARLQIPDDQITADIHNLRVEDVAPGQKKVDFTVAIQNQWHPVNVDTVEADVAGNTVELPVDGRIDTGTTEYTVTDRFDRYDPSAFLVNEEINESIQLRFVDPWIPSDQLSGSGDRDGDLTEAENVAVHGFGMEAFQSRPAYFQTRVQYCGENATFVENRCVIDETVHLRSDLCPLLSNHMVVTETFLPGTHSMDELEPEPAFFCTKHPTLVTDSETNQQTEMITAPYRSLLEDGQFTVPEDQTYTLFWTVNTDENDVKVVCDSDEALDSEGNCQTASGVIHKCTEGVWNPTTGSCVIHPGVEHVCERGRYNEDLNKCVFQPPVQAGDCPVGTQTGKQGQLCYAEASVERVCPENVDGEMRDGKCHAEAEVLRQRNVLGDFRVAFVSLFNAIEDLALFWK